MGPSKVSRSRRRYPRAEETLPRRTRIAAERDAWIGAAPGRAFEVSVNQTRSEWRIALTERGRVVVAGSGETWESALDAALRAARANGRAEEH
jgi:hypothetical protein